MHADLPTDLFAARKADPVRLSKRETEVLAYAVGGKSCQNIADELFVSRRTVEYHLANAYAKLGARNRLQAIGRARKLGLLSAETSLSQPDAERHPHT